MDEQQGLHQKYIISKTDGTPIDPDMELQAIYAKPRS